MQRQTTQYILQRLPNLPENKHAHTRRSNPTISHRNGKKTSINYIPLLFGHTSLAEAGSQYCPYVHEHNPAGSHEASAE